MIATTPESWYLHENYTSWDYRGTLFQLTNDIALIKLKKGFSRTTARDFYAINTICLPNDSPEFNTEAQEVTFFGFGRDNTTCYSQRLQKRDGVLIPANECSIKKLLCANYYNLAPRTCSVIQTSFLVPN